jgi:hypothetical protein
MFSEQSTTTWWTGVPLIDVMVRDGVCSGDVVELFGSSGVGKSELMWQLAIKCVLPLELGGSNCTCVLFDNDCKFDPRRLVVVLLATLQRVRQQCVDPAAVTHVDDASVFDALLRQSLQRIRVIRPRDVVDFVLALRALPDLLDSLTTPCRLLLIDSISVWHWPLQNDPDGSLYERDLARFVREVAERHDLVVFASKQYLFVNANADALQQHRAVAPSVPLHREYLCRAWVELVRLRVTLTCDIIDNSNGVVYEDAAEPRFMAYAVENVDWRGRTSNEPTRRQTQAFGIAKSGLHFVGAPKAIGGAA